MTKTLEKIGAILFLILSVGYNLWLYRNEPSVSIDPNDNAFQYALVDRTDTMWDYADRTCPSGFSSTTCHIAILTDHWVPNWEEGYNLPYYYSHVPQILIVGSYRLLHAFFSSVSLFTYYHFVIYLLLCLFPLSVFVAFRVLGTSWRTTGLAALLASQISTDGLYGIDQSSFLWRGWGLSSQLFALVWYPLVIATCIRFLKEKKDTISRTRFAILSMLFLLCTTTGHLGIGIMAFMSVGIICLTPAFMGILRQRKWREIVTTAWEGIRHTCVICIPVLVLLGYWIIPTVTKSMYHNISVWDPIWKFNSFGVTEVITMLVNGSLFDFNRLPIFTLLLGVGVFVCLLGKQAEDEHMESLPFLFIGFLLLFFGNTTWGGFLNIIPGMQDFHQHRFIVGVHMAGLFLAPVGLAWILDQVETIGKRIWKRVPVGGLVITQCVILLLVAWAIVPQIYSYASYNDTLIRQANARYTSDADNIHELLTTLRSLEKDNPGRVYALRGTEGKDFKTATISAWYMYLSTHGIPTVLWLPETWSLNADTEQFFSEDVAAHYALYNIRYVVAPPDKKPQPFWHIIKQTTAWNLYTVDTDGYITVGTAPSVVTTDKQSFVNLIHLWIQSDYPKQHLYPQLVMTKTSPSTTLPHFSMMDEVTYRTPDMKIHNLFAAPPVYQSPFFAKTMNDTTARIETAPPITIRAETSDTDTVFSAQVDVENQCPTCVVILKQTYHPGWQTTVNGKPVTPIQVFPSYVAVRLEQPGIYTVVFSYRPSREKQVLMFGSIIVLGIGCLFFFRRHR